MNAKEPYNVLRFRAMRTKALIIGYFFIGSKRIIYLLNVGVSAQGYRFLQLRILTPALLYLPRVCSGLPKNIFIYDYFCHLFVLCFP